MGEMASVFICTWGMVIFSICSDFLVLNLGINFFYSFFSFLNYLLLSNVFNGTALTFLKFVSRWILCGGYDYLIICARSDLLTIFLLIISFNLSILSLLSINYFISNKGLSSLGTNSVLCFLPSDGSIISLLDRKSPLILVTAIFEANESLVYSPDFEALNDLFIILIFFLGYYYSR